MDLETWPPAGPYGWLGEDELTSLALAAGDPDAPLPDDAVPLTSFAPELPGLLPAWYMPKPASFARTRRRRIVVGLLLVSFFAINALGLCVTSGRLTIAW